MSKMGISTIRSYRGAKIFEAVGLGKDLLKTYFGTKQSSIGGIGLKEVADDALRFHRAAFSAQPSLNAAALGELLPHVGQFSYRKDGIAHAWNPETIAALQLATRLGSYKKFKEFTRLADEKPAPIFLRDFFEFRKAAAPVPLE